MKNTKPKTVSLSVKVPLATVAAVAFHFDEAYQYYGVLDEEAVLEAATLLTLIDRAAARVPMRVLADALAAALHNARGDDALAAELLDELAGAIGEQREAA